MRSSTVATMAKENAAPSVARTTALATKLEGVFRGGWAPTLEIPVHQQVKKFGERDAKFVPVAVAMEPYGALAPKQETTTTSTTTTTTNTAPAKSEIHLTVIDRFGDYRACIAKDGRVLNARHELIGYVSGNEAGSVSERYLGRVYATTYDNKYQVWAATGEPAPNDESLIAFIDMGTHAVRAPEGSTLFDLEQGGRVRACNGTVLGRFEGARGFHDLETIALYLLLVDPTFTCPDERLNEAEQVAEPQGVEKEDRLVAPEAAATPDRPRATAPPPGVDVHLAIYDRHGDYRACIAKDGRVLDSYHDLAGFLSGVEAGTHDEKYIGRVHAPLHDSVHQLWMAGDAAGLDRDVHDEVLVAVIDMGTHTVREPSGSTLFDVEQGGRVRSRNGTRLAEFRGARGFFDVETMAMYILFFDRGLIRDDELGGC